MIFSKSKTQFLIKFYISEMNIDDREPIEKWEIIFN